MFDFYYSRSENFEPDFTNLLQVLRGNIPNRTTLFEFGINERLIRKLSGQAIEDSSSRLAHLKD